MITKQIFPKIWYLGIHTGKLGSYLLTTHNWGFIDNSKIQPRQSFTNTNIVQQATELHLPQVDLIIYNQNCQANEQSLQTWPKLHLQWTEPTLIQ